MIAAGRSRLPWVLWVVGMFTLATTVTLTYLNRRTAFDEDPYFVPIAVIMILGYSTVGAVLASRNPRSPIGWLMMAVGLTFAFTGGTSEYLTYAYVTNPGAPIGPAVAMLSNILFLPMFVAVILLVLLFPAGRVPGPRWRYLPAAIVGFGALAMLGGLLMPGLLDLDQPIRVINPIGVEALRPVLEFTSAVAWIALLSTAPLSIVALVLRYRRSRGEERQQMRWLAYTAATTAAVIISGIALSLIFGDSYGDTLVADALFIAGFGLIGIGVPVAMGTAVLRYRLYDLDLVVKKTVLYVTVAAVLSAAFVAVAVAIGWIAGRSDTGAVIAAVAVGLAFWPALRLARRLADRIVYGQRATPYEVLAEFSDRVGASYGSEDVLPRMAQILRDAVGAAKAIVWLRVGDELRAAGVVPMEDAPRPVRLSGDELPSLGADAAVEVRDRGELLGALAVSMPPNDPMSPSRERLVRDLAAQAGLVLRNVRLIEELRASRQRLVAAQDQERRRIERNIHDGAQQQLVALAVKLRLADALVGKDEPRAHAMLAELQDETNGALENLRDLARGIYPPLLADKGLVAALEGQARKSALPVSVDAGVVGRYSQDVEAAVYFCALEALQNVAKYAGASTARVRLHAANGTLGFDVEDDGRGFDPSAVSGSGLTNMRDRLDALGGALEVRSSPGRGTTISGRIPVMGTR
ncbi:MAG: sensor histidine kinase [Actinomycetota bacterium]